MAAQASDLTGRVAALERANAQLTHFAHLAAHDLQEPLRVVAGYLDLLMRHHEGGLQLDAAKATRAAMDATIRMKLVVDDLLGSASLHEIGPSTTRVSLEAAFTTALKNLHPAIGEAKATITHDPLPFVTGDESRLTRVFQNLLSNALKFRRPGVPPRITVRSEREGGMLHVSVSDNGIGFSMLDAERIFQPLQRLHGDSYGGTGLGLTSSRAIIEAQGGRIWAESSPESGSVFHFTLPEARSPGGSA